MKFDKIPLNELSVLNKSNLYLILNKLVEFFSIKKLLAIFIVLDIFLLAHIGSMQNVTNPNGVATENDIESSENQDSSLQEISPEFESEIVSYMLKSGDTLVGVLMHHNVSSTAAHEISSKIHKIYDLKKLSIGQEIALKFNEDEQLQNLTFITSDRMSEIHATINQKNEFEVKQEPIIFAKTINRVHATINSSFVLTAKQMGLSTKSIMEIVKSYSYDIDFQRDIKTGHAIDVVFEKFYNKENGEFSHTGRVLYSSLIMGKKKLEIYNYKDAKGNENYYKDDARSIKKSLLRTPVKVVRISSKYGMRKHPVLGYSKMHKGVDFAAPIGTPIFAAGHGKVVEMGWKGGYGKYMRLRHSNGYQTAYAHINKYAKNLKKGQRVKQGQIIAFVGKTGRATGAHLHYEVLINGKHVNPLRIKLSPGKKLVGKELKKFNLFKKEIGSFVKNSDKRMEVNIELTNFSKMV